MSRLEVETGPLVRATLALPADGMQRAVERGGPLTPYAMQEIVEDALHAGPGASLDLCVAEPAGEEWLARLREVRERLCRRGIEVRLRRTAEGFR
jgi:hypothetical protein